VIFGVIEKESLKAMADLSRREAAMLFPLVILVIFFGFYPAPILDVFGASVDNLVNQVVAGIEAASRSPRRNSSDRVHPVMLETHIGADMLVALPEIFWRWPPWRCSCSACSARTSRPIWSTPPAWWCSR
jgi:hypothetical protein